MSEAIVKWSDTNMVNVPVGYKLIFRRYKQDPRNGRKLDAKQYGHKAWPILIPDEELDDDSDSEE
jgi:hypothetical protein